MMRNLILMMTLLLTVGVSLNGCGDDGTDGASMNDGPQATAARPDSGDTDEFMWTGNIWTLETLMDDLNLEDANGEPDPDPEALLALSIMLSETNPEQEDALELAVFNTVQEIGEDTFTRLTPAERLDQILSVHRDMGVDLEAEARKVKATGIELGILMPSPLQMKQLGPVLGWTLTIMKAAFDSLKGNPVAECQKRRRTCEEKAKECKDAGGTTFKDPPTKANSYNENYGVTYAHGVPPDYQGDSGNFYCWVGCRLEGNQGWTFNGQYGTTTAFPRTR